MVPFLRSFTPFRNWLGRELMVRSTKWFISKPTKNTPLSWLRSAAAPTSNGSAMRLEFKCTSLNAPNSLVSRRPSRQTTSSTCSYLTWRECLLTSSRVGTATTLRMWPDISCSRFCLGWNSSTRERSFTEILRLIIFWSTWREKSESQILVTRVPCSQTKDSQSVTELVHHGGLLPKSVLSKSTTFSAIFGPSVSCALKLPWVTHQNSAKCRPTKRWSRQKMAPHQTSIKASGRPRSRILSNAALSRTSMSALPPVSSLRMNSCKALPSTKTHTSKTSSSSTRLRTVTMSLLELQDPKKWGGEPGLTKDWSI